MTQEKKVQIAAGMDVSGVEKSAQDLVRTMAGMADGVGKESRRASDEVEKIGDGAAAADAKIDAKTKSIADRLRRLTVSTQRELAGLAATSQGGAGSAAAVEYEAAFKGADTSKLQRQLGLLRELEQQATSLSAAMRQAQAGNSFLASVEAQTVALQRQAQAMKGVEQDALALKAAELGVSQQASLLISKQREATAAVNALAEANRKASTGKSFLDGLKFDTAAIGKTRADLLELKAAELGVSQQAAGMISAIRAADDPLNRLGLTAKQAAFAIRGVPAQVTDIVTSLQGGQNPLTVFLQQGGQLKDMFGGVGNAAKALGGYLIGMVNPFTLGAVAAGILGYALYKGSAETQAYSRALIQSGNAAGTTAGQLDVMARAISDASRGATIGKAAEVLVQMAGSGAVGAENLKRFTAAAIEMERAGGQAAADTAKQFSDLSKEPYSAAIKLNEGVNFLSASIIRQIKDFEDQGRSVDAARLAQEAYSSALESRTPQMLNQLGVLERAWLAVADASKKAVDRLLSVGRQSSTNSLAADISASIADIDSGKLGPRAKDDLPALREQLIILQQAAGYEATSAAYERDKAENAKLYAGWLKEGDSFLAKRDKAAREIAKTEREGAQLIRAGIITQEELAGRVASIRDKYKETPKSDSGLGRAKLAEEIALIKAAEQERQAIYKQSEGIVEATKQAGLITDKTYYEAKREFLQAELVSKLDALDKEGAALKRFSGTPTENVQVQKDMAKVTGEVAKARADAAGKTEILRIQEAALATTQAASLVVMRAQYGAEIALINRTARLSTERAGLGDRARREAEEIESISAQFTQRQLQMESDLARGKYANNEQAYIDEYGLLLQFEERVIAAKLASQVRQRQIAADGANGLSKASQTYVENASNVSSQIESLTTKAFGGMEDALVSFVATGKLSFSKLAESIIADISRIIIKQQIMLPLLSAIGIGSSGGGGIGSFLGSLIGQRATGGPVVAGGMYEINETKQGPGEVLDAGGKQYLMASRSGTVIPTGRGAALKNSGGGSDVHMHITNNFAAGITPDQFRSQLAASEARTIASMVDLRKRSIIV